MVKLLRIDDTKFIGTNYENTPFTIIDISTGEKFDFGNFPISEKVGNSMDVFQGTIKFNKEMDFLAYASFSTKYLSLYSLEKGEKIPTLLWEKSILEPKFRISNNHLEWEKEQEKGFSNLCLTKDFVVVSFKEGLNIMENGRRVELIPQSLYVFDYDGNLVKHLDSNIPILRISDNLESNTVFAIGASPEFCLMKFDLDNL